MRDIEIKCPVCKHRFQAKAILSTNTAGSLSTEGQARAAGGQPLPGMIHMCPNCGYSGYKHDFHKKRVNRRLKRLVRNRLLPVIQDEKGLPSRKYELAAEIAKWRGDSDIHIGTCYLRAAWCAEDEANKNQATSGRIQAIGFFEKAVAEKSVPEDDVAFYTYLIGELHRRVGEKTHAGQWFDRVITAFSHDEAKKWIYDLAMQQKKHPRAYIRG